ncbi:MAG: M36 family metallopeptidase, partial [Verrucomicrobia bacterium]|nr:M36 family metallopeptidase [Verrucomicrobiota bacterium]
ETGGVLLRHCLTAYLSDATYNVFTNDSPTPFSPGWPTPNTNQPPQVSRTLVTLPALNTNASPEGWIPDGSNETRGNNVDAHLDRNSDDLPDLPRPQGSPFRVFNFPLDLTQPPTDTNNQKAAVVQLFYLCNWYHDKMYELGFTEAAGNFQSNNFGRGGVANDAVQADAQDGSGTDNANFATYSDGVPGRMQMYLFTGPNPDRDGDFDVEVVFHEHTHGLSNRRVGNGALISEFQTAGMGEGWSDFYALTLLAEPGDDLSGNFAAAAYATLNFFGETENYYYGIRRYPYSTNLGKNPLTFKDIDPAQASSHPGIPRNPAPIFGAADEVHNQGEVWCVTLWEVRVQLVQKHGFAVGNQLALQLVTDGMGLSPANPNFLQARDAILQADLVDTGGANQAELWLAFAKRGMGFSASSPASSTTAGVVESFDLPDDLRISPPTGTTFKGPVGGPFLPTSKTFVLTNAGSNALTWTMTATTNWLGFTSNSGSLNVAQSFTNTVSLNSNALALAAGVFTNTLTFSNQISGRTQTRTFVIAVGQPDYYTELFDNSDFDLSFTSILFTPDGSTNFYGQCRQATAAFPTDPTGGTSLALTDDSFLQVTLTNAAQVKLYGSSRNTFFIGSNGYLTFDTGDNQYQESFANHFNRLRVSGYFLDLDLPLSPGGSVSWKQLADRVAVTWQNDRRWGTTNANNFQIEMFFDGRIRLTWLQIDNANGLAGLSRGTGVPPAFFESDLSVSPSCPVPLLLTVPSSTSEGAGVLTNAGVVALPAAQASDLVVSLVSSDLTKITVPTNVTIPAGQTSNRFNLTVVDNLIYDGPKTVLVTASATGWLPVTNSVVVNDNEVPTLSVLLPAAALESAGVLTNQGRVVMDYPALTNTTITLTSSNLAKLQVPPSVLLGAGQTSAVFDLTTVDNLIVDGNVSVAVGASEPGFHAGSGTMLIFDDDVPTSPFLDRFALSAVGSPQVAGFPFSLSVTAKTVTNTTDTNFIAFAQLLALRAAPNPALTVRTHVFTGYSPYATYVSNTLAALTNNFTNVLLITTDTTSPAALRAELADQHVFLVPEQAGTGDALGLGQSWAPVLKDFVARGGIVVFCTFDQEASLILNGTGLMSVALVSTDSPVTDTRLTNHVLTAGLPVGFVVDNASGFVVFDGVPLLRRDVDSSFNAAFRDFGLGHAVLIGTDFTVPGSQLDLMLANAVQWAQSNLYLPVTLTPVVTENFSSGQWGGSVTGAVPATGVLLMATDGNGHFGLSNPFNLVTNTPPVASNLSFVIPQNAATNLALAGFDADGQTLTFAITTVPTNGLLAAVAATNFLFTYTPGHAFAGADHFNYAVSDGLATSAPALVSITVTNLTDTDGDGIPDAWEIAHGLNPNVNDANLDPDQDGFTNLQEYLANTDPHDAASLPAEPLVVALPGGGLRITWKSVGGVRYRVQFSDGDAGGGFNGVFTDVVRSAAGEIDPAAVGASSTMQFDDNFILTGGAPAQGRRYYRIKVMR